MKFKADKDSKTPSNKQLMNAVTDNLVELMKTEGAHWTKPFASKGCLPVNASTGKEYSGSNVLLLMMGTEDCEFAGYHQWVKLGAKVKKGESGHAIVRPHIAKDKKDPEKKFIAGFGITYVFGRSQLDNPPPSIIEPSNSIDLTERLAIADSYFAATGAKIYHSESGKAFYSPQSDAITIPSRELFSATKTSTATETYYSTLAHECIHWTGNSKRLDRIKHSSFGDDLYAFEELIAEIGAAMLSVKLGISNEPRADHAEYLNSWIANLQDDPDAMFKAAKKAYQAIQLIDGFQTNQAAAA
jgi:antirestriction protein ArdC